MPIWTDSNYNDINYMYEIFLVSVEREVEPSVILLDYATITYHLLSLHPEKSKRGWVENKNNFLFSNAVSQVHTNPGTLHWSEASFPSHYYSSWWNRVTNVISLGFRSVCPGQAYTVYLCGVIFKERNRNFCHII